MNVMEFTQEHPQNFIKELKEALTPYNTDLSYQRDWNEDNFYWNYKNWVKNTKRIKYCAGCGDYKFSWMKNYDENKRCCNKCGWHFK